MSAHSYAPSPDLSDLMRRFDIESLDDRSESVGSPEHTLPPPAPAPIERAKPQRMPQPTTRQRRSEEPILASTDSFRVAHAPLKPEFQRPPFNQTATGGWNCSTQVAKGPAKALQHQILCRNYVPPAANVVERKRADQLLRRLAKTTISSRLKGPVACSPDASEPSVPPKTVEVDRKRLHLQQRITSQKNANGREETVRCGREGIELLLFYRKEVEKRLRVDPLYALHHTGQT